MWYCFWKSPVLRTVSSVFCGSLLMLAVALPLAVLLLFLHVPERFLILLSDLLWCLGAFFAGRLSGKHARIQGILTGISCGILLSSILLGGAVFLEIPLSARLLRRCGILTFCAVCGGICGVNTEITKPPY